MNKYRFEYDLLKKLSNEAFLMSEINNIINNTLYYHSNNGYNIYMSSFTFIDIDNRIFTVNVYYSNCELSQIKDMIIKKYALTISDSLNYIKYTTLVNTKKQLENSVYEYINYSNLLY